MVTKRQLVISLLAGAVVATGALAQPSQMDLMKAQAKKPRYLPEYTESGDLILPKNFREWVYVGSPLTPCDKERAHHD
jgi:hypothetical protein